MSKPSSKPATTPAKQPQPPAVAKQPPAVEFVEFESPYRAETHDKVKRNILYARIVCRHLLNEGYAPYCSHLLYTQPSILNDNKDKDRRIGIESGKAISEGVTRMFFARDLGTSEGMKYGEDKARERGLDIEDIFLFTGDIQDWSYSTLLDVAMTKKLIDGDDTRIGWTPESKAPSRFEVWKEYESIAIHFNGLLIKLRTGALGVVASVGALGSVLAKSGETAPDLSLVFFALAAFWASIAILDLFYYRTLLAGSVLAITELEKSPTTSPVTHLGLSSQIEKKGTFKKLISEPKFGAGDAVRAFFNMGVVVPVIFYISVLFTLLFMSKNPTLTDTFPSYTFSVPAVLAVVGIIAVTAWITYTIVKPKEN